MTKKSVAFAAPVVAAALVTGGALVPKLQSGASTNLPRLSADQIIAKALNSHVSDFSGNFAWTTNLGLPDLSEVTSALGQSTSGGGFSPSELISGTHNFHVWSAANRGEFRVATGGSASQTDLVVNRSGVYAYDGSSSHVTLYKVGRHSARPAGHKDLGAAQHTALGKVQVADVAKAVLRLARASDSVVTAGPTAAVAGRSAYTVVIAPSSAAANADSTVRKVVIAVDAATGMPLRVSIMAKHQASPALQIGFTSISFATPASSIFATPKGASVSTTRLGGSDATTRVFPQARSQTRVTTRNGVEQSSTFTLHSVVERRASRSVVQRQAVSEAGPLGRTSMLSHASPWATIVDLGKAGGPGVIPGAVNSAPGETRSFLNSQQLNDLTTPVSGTWGSGRLLSTSLINVLVLPNGRILAGDVSAHALEARAASISH